MTDWSWCADWQMSDQQARCRRRHVHVHIHMQWHTSRGTVESRVQSRRAWLCLWECLLLGVKATNSMMCWEVQPLQQKHVKENDSKLRFFCLVLLMMLVQWLLKGRQCDLCPFSDWPLCNSVSHNQDCCVNQNCAWAVDYKMSVYCFLWHLIMSA